MLLYAAQLLTVTGRENAIVTYSDEMVRQYMKRQQIQKSINGSGHNLMFACFPVILVIVQDFGVGHIQDSGIGYGHTVGIAPDVFEHLSDSLGRRLGMNDPGFAETLLAGGLWDGGSLLLQPACQQIHETSTELVAHGSHREEERRTSASMNLVMKQEPVPVVPGGSRRLLIVLSAYCARRNFLVNSEMRSSNLGIAAIALSKYVLGMVYCGAGE